MSYAVVKTGGKQYRVTKGRIIEIDKAELEIGKEALFDNVLLAVVDGKVKIGKPKVRDVKVKAKAIGNIKGSKIKVSKFKAKSRYRRVIGFRPSLTRLQIEDIVLSK